MEQPDYNKAWQKVWEDLGYNTQQPYPAADMQIVLNFLNRSAGNPVNVTVLEHEAISALLAHIIRDYTP